MPDLTVDGEDEIVDDDEDGSIADDGLKMEHKDEDEGVEEARGLGRQGKDLPWETKHEFATMEEFEASNLPAEVAVNYLIRSGKFSNIETYYRKFSIKKRVIVTNLRGGLGILSLWIKFLLKGLVKSTTMS